MKYLLLLLMFGPMGFASSANLTGSSEGVSFSVRELAKFSDVVWGMDFIDPDTMILTNRGGEMYLLPLSSKKPIKIKNVPAVFSAGQGGLLDIRVWNPGPKPKLFFTISQPRPEGPTTALISADLSGDKNSEPALSNIKVLLSAKASSSAGHHFGSRIEFMPAKKKGEAFLFLSVGDRDERKLAQSLSAHNGKILRLNLDGTVPSDNPFVGKAGELPEIWSYGHRNPQGLALRPGTEELWSSEFGPRGGDEINRIQKALNYGWPVVTYGREYWGPSIGEGNTKAGMESPVAKYVPSISPSGITFYSGDVFPKWKDNLFVANLSGTHVRRLALKGQAVEKEEVLLDKLGWRFRVVRQGPDGFLYLGTDEGRLVRLEPQARAKAL